jgi:CRISPR-associated protein Cas1
MPVGLMLPLCGNKMQTEKFNAQIQATDPLKKNLWQQTIKARIKNQTGVLRKFRSCNVRNMEYWAGNSSLAQCFEGKLRKIKYPEFVM